jgi:hypothetical protein
MGVARGSGLTSFEMPQARRKRDVLERREPVYFIGKDITYTSLPGWVVVGTPPT